MSEFDIIVEKVLFPHCILLLSHRLLTNLHNQMLPWIVKQIASMGNPWHGDEVPSEPIFILMSASSWFHVSKHIYNENFMGTGGILAYIFSDSQPMIDRIYMNVLCFFKNKRKVIHHLCMGSMVVVVAYAFWRFAISG